MTLLVVSGDHIPASIEELVRAMKSIPAYAASFLLIMRFWTSHADWSRRYGLDDAVSRYLSLLLVFLVLIFVYPMKMVFSTLFNAVSQGYFPANFTLTSLTELPVMFATFAVAFGAMALVMAALHGHAWRQRIALGLSLDELANTRLAMLDWALVAAVAVVSIVLAWAVPARAESGWWLGAPGFVFFLINLGQPLLRWRVRQWRQRQLPA